MLIARPRRSRTCNVPLGGSQYFSGREQELRDVRELLKGTETVGVVACVEGLAGIGKTELALQLVERLAAEGEYPGGLFWFNAEQPDLTSTWGSVVADELALPAMPIAERAVAAVAHLRQLQEPVLLVLDNVEQWKVGNQPHPLPTGPHIKTLITTRYKKLGGLQFQHYPLKFLPPTAARELLQRLAGASIDQQPGFAELIEHLGGHALALERCLLDVHALRNDCPIPDLSVCLS